MGFHSEIGGGGASDEDTVVGIVGEIIDNAVDESRDSEVASDLLCSLQIEIDGGGHGLGGVGGLVEISDQILEHNIGAVGLGVGMNLSVGGADVSGGDTVVAKTAGLYIPHALDGGRKYQSPARNLCVKHEIGVELLVDATFVGSVDADELLADGRRAYDVVDGGEEHLRIGIAAAKPCSVDDKRGADSLPSGGVDLKFDALLVDSAAVGGLPVAVEDGGVFIGEVGKDGRRRE